MEIESKNAFLFFFYECSEVYCRLLSKAFKTFYHAMFLGGGGLAFKIANEQESIT